MVNIMKEVMKSNQSVSLTTKLRNETFQKSSGIIFASEEHEINHFFGQGSDIPTIQKTWIIEGIFQELSKMCR